MGAVIAGLAGVRLTLLLLAAIAGGGNSAVQPNPQLTTPSVVTIGTEQRLPSLEVNSIAEDSSGLMWFATSAGIVHWNGNEAVPHQTLDVDANGTRVNANTHSVVPDPNGGVWAASKQLVHINPWSDVVTVLDHVADQITSSGTDAIWIWSPGTAQRFILESRTVELSVDVDLEPLVPDNLAIGSDSQGRLYLGSQWGVLAVDTNGTQVEWTIGSGINAIATRGDGDMLLAGVSGLWTLAANSRPERLAPLGWADSSRSDEWTPSTAMVERSDGSIWVGDTNGIGHIYSDGLWSESTEMSFAVSGQIDQLFEDSHGGLWASQSGSGIVHLSGHPPRFGSIESVGVLTEAGVSAAITDVIYSDNSLVVSTQGAGLQRYEIESDQWSSIELQLDRSDDPTRPEPTLDQIRTIADTGNVLWIGTWGDGLFRLNKETAEVALVPAHGSGFIHDLVPDSSGNIWASTWGTGVLQFDERGIVRSRLSPDDAFQIRNSRVRAIETGSNLIYLGGDAGLDVVDISSRFVGSYSNENGSLTGSEVIDIFVETPNVVWLATDAGLERLDLEISKSTLFGANDGLAPSQVTHVLPHHSDRAIWLASDQGLAQFDLDAEKIAATFAATNGLPSTSLVPAANAVDELGNSYLASTTSIAVVPAGPGPNVTSQEPLFVRCLEGCGTDFDGHQVKTDGSEVTFEWFSNNAALGAGARFEYRLNGHEQGWVTPALAQQSVTYRKLGAGIYQFEARIVATDGTFLQATTLGTAGGTLAVEVTYPWWQSRSVRFTVLFFVVWALAMAAALRSVRSRQNARRLEALVDERTVELQAAANDAEEANTAKTRFLSMVTHEFRSPLTSVLGYADLLEAESESAEQRDWAAAIRLSGQHLEAMMSDILHFTSRENASPRTNDEPTHLGELGHEVVRMFQNDARSRRMVVKCKVDPCASEASYSVDRRRLRQVLINLIANALRHSTGNQVDLAITCARGVDGRDRLSFTVTDDGDGIDDDDLLDIFKPWSRGSDAAGPGLGLGLTISQEIVAMLGGELELDLSQGVTEFGFELRMDRTAELTPTDSAQTKVLLVDDDEFSREVVRDLLNALGYQVNSCSSASAALEAVASFEPLIVLTDIMMPEMSGVEMALSMRSLTTTSTLHIVAMTGLPDYESNSDLFDALLAKPFGLGPLAETLTSLDGSDPEESGQVNVASSGV